jgi:adenine C2-methylase RlmN of 23S rRNA A2503 and tRNA A37
MLDVQRFSLAAQHICVSTVGVVPRMRTFASELPGVSLALSLHASNQELRKRIVPTATAWPLPKIMDALDVYIEQRRTSAGKKDKVSHWWCGLCSCGVDKMLAKPRRK